MGTVTSHRCDIFQLWERGDTWPETLLGYVEYRSIADFKKWVTERERDGEGKRLAFQAMWEVIVTTGEAEMGLTCGLWSLIGPAACRVISSWCRRWKGSAIYQHLWVNLSRLQRLGAAGADYQGTTPTAHILTALVHAHLLHAAMLGYYHPRPKSLLHMDVTF